MTFICINRHTIENYSNQNKDNSKLKRVTITKENNNNHKRTKYETSNLCFGQRTSSFL